MTVLERWLKPKRFCLIRSFIFFLAEQLVFQYPERIVPNRASFMLSIFVHFFWTHEMKEKSYDKANVWVYVFIDYRSIDGSIDLVIIFFSLHLFNLGWMDVLNNPILFCQYRFFECDAHWDTHTHMLLWQSHLSIRHWNRMKAALAQQTLQIVIYSISEP